METHTQKKGFSFATILTLFVFLATIGVTGYFLFQEYTTKNAINGVEDVLETKNKNLLKLTDQLAFEDFMNTFEALDRAEEQRIRWARVVRVIFAFENDNVSFESFSSHKNKKVALRGTAKSINDITALLEHLKKNSDQIESPFVNNLGPESADDGRTVYRFELTFDSLIS